MWLFCGTDRYNNGTNDRGNDAYAFPMFVGTPRKQYRIDDDDWDYEQAYVCYVIIVLYIIT